WEQLVKTVGGNSWQALLETSDDRRLANEVTNLSVAMGDLASALNQAGSRDEALEVAENALRIDTAQGSLRNVAAGRGQCASILADSNRYHEADARYDVALHGALAARDVNLEATLMQQQGGVACELNQFDRATRLYTQALQRFQEADNRASTMQT